MENKTRNSKGLLILALITTIIAVILSLSKYQTTRADKDSGSVAIPVLSMSDETINVEINPIENENEYIFKVQNYSDELESEVTMNYTLQIKSLSNLPLEFELYTYDEDEQTTGDTNLIDGTSITDTKSIEYGENEDVYKLIVKWREGESYNSYKYSGIIDYVQIILYSVQVD